MPRQMNAAEELGLLFGELVNDDVECWEVSPDGDGALMRLTRDGIDWHLTIRDRHEPEPAPVATVKPYLAAYAVADGMKMFGGNCGAMGCSALREHGRYCHWHAAAYQPSESPGYFFGQTGRDE